MGIPYSRIGQGNIFDIKRARALRDLHDEAAARTAFPAPAGVPFMTDGKAPIPWRIIPGIEGLSAIFDADNHFVMHAKTALVERIVEAMNEFEGQIAHG